MYIAKTIADLDRYFGTYTTIKKLTIVADTENSNSKNVDGRGGFYGTFHQELEELAEVIYAPLPHGDYIIPNSDTMDIIALKKSRAEAEGKPVVYQRTDFSQSGVAVDTKSSASEFYSNFKSWGRGKLGGILIRLMRAKSAAVQLIYLVIDDQIVDNPEDWEYHAKTAHWKAWDDLKGLIEYAERAFGIQVVFCRRAHAVDALIRALLATGSRLCFADAHTQLTH